MSALIGLDSLSAWANAGIAANKVVSANTDATTAERLGFMPHPPQWPHGLTDARSPRTLQLSRRTVTFQTQPVRSAGSGSGLREPILAAAAFARPAHQLQPLHRLPLADPPHRHELGDLPRARPGLS